MREEQLRTSARPGGARLLAIGLPVCCLLLGAGGGVSCGGGTVTVTVTITPATLSLTPGGTYTFAATVSGTTNMAVTWRVQEASGGTITPAGFYTAPATEGTYRVIATSVADPAATASVTVTVAWTTGQEALIIDNRDAGFSVVSGDWGEAGPDDGNGCWGSDFRYLFANRGDVGRARFTPALSARALYAIYIYWSAASNRTTEQPVIVHDANGADTPYRVDLQQHGNQWYFLGPHMMGPTGCYIEFNNDTDDGYCNADAVLLANPDTGVISGQVRDAEDQPIEGATVTVQGTALQTTANERGQYTIPNVSAGSRTVIVTAVGFDPGTQALTVTASTSQVADFSLTPAGGPSETGTIQGVVRDAATEDPIPNATATVQGTALQATTDGQGRYSIPNVPAGSRTVVATASGYVSQNRSVNVVADSTIQADFSLTPSGNAGRLTNLFFLHHSTGNGFIEEGDMRGVIAAHNAEHGTSYAFWDHGYNDEGLRNPAGAWTGTSYRIPNDNTDPDGLHVLWTTDNAARRSILNHHQVIAFKSCFPSSAIEDAATLQQYRTWYLEMRDFFDTRPDRLFVVMSTPPLHRLDTNPTAAANARAFANWLSSGTYLNGHPNVRCFNLFNHLAKADDGSATANMLRYEYEGSHTDSDSHPNTLANQTVGPIFAEFLCDAAASYSGRQGGDGSYDR